MSSINKELRQRSGKLVDELGDAGINLREHLKDPENFNNFNASVAEKIADLEDSILEAKFTLPDGTGREIFVWEYAALEKLATDNGKEIEEFLGEKIYIENSSMVDVDFSSKSLRDISAVSVLINLQRLELRFNQISDISAVSGLINLQWLFLSRNQIQYISAVSGLSSLRGLWLAENPIQDSQIPVIESLKARGVQVYE